MSENNLDRITQNFLNNLDAAKPLYEMTPDEARNFLSNLQQKYYEEIPAQVEDISIFSETAGDISVRLVRDKNLKNEKLPLIVYCHGGGWVMGDADAYDMTIRTIANHTKAAVAFVNYPRSPEFKYPEALNHICETVKYLKENGYNINPEKIALAGDSAGGNMAIAAALKLKNEIKICSVALIYPVTDFEMKTESYKEFKDGPWLTKKAMEYFWNCYLPDKKYGKEIYTSPLQAEINKLKNLPPVLIITAENDVLRDEGEEFARKLIEAGVDTACVRINNTIHDFLLLNGLRKSKAVHAAYKLVCGFLKHALHN